MEKAVLFWPLCPFFLKKNASVKIGLEKMRYSQGELQGKALRLMRGEAVGGGGIFQQNLKRYVTEVVGEEIILLDKKES